MRTKLFRILSIAYLIMLILLMIIPLGGSGVKMNNTYVVGFRGDYLLHILVYTPWLIVGKYLFKDGFKLIGWLVFGIIVAVGLEFTQLLLPYRGFNINDVIFSVLGVLFSTIIYYLFKNQI